jgi:hypothetical protein
MMTRKDLEGIGRDLTEVLSRNLPGRTKKTHETSVRIGGDSIEIRTEHLLNTNLKRYL